MTFLPEIRVLGFFILAGPNVCLGKIYRLESLLDFSFADLQFTLFANLFSVDSTASRQWHPGV